MIRDYEVEWLRKRVWLPAIGFNGVSVGQATAAFAAGTGIGQQGATAGNVVAVQIASSGVSAVKLTANTDTMTTAWMMPYDFDLTKRLDLRIHWSNSSTAAAQQWVLKYALLKAPANHDLVAVGSTSTTPGNTNLGVIAAPATALDVTIPAATSNGTANTWEITDYGSILKASLAATPITTTTYAIAFQIGMSGALTGVPAVIGLELRYSARRTIGQRRNIIGGRRLAEVLGVQWTQTKQEGL